MGPILHDYKSGRVSLADSPDDSRSVVYDTFDFVVFCLSRLVACGGRAWGGSGGGGLLLLFHLDLGDYVN